MLHNLPGQYREDPWILALSGAIGGVLAGQTELAASIPDQLSLNKLTWALETEERVAGIVPPPGAALEARRSALKARWRANGKVGLEQIQAVADAWRNGEVAVSFTQGRIHIQFVGSFGVPADMDGLKLAVGRTVPAHLPVDYTLRYLLIRDIHAAMTLSELERTPLNHFAGGD